MNSVQSVAIKKKGTTAEGKAYTLFEVVLEDGRKATGFDHVKVGDRVALKQTKNYLNYTFIEGEGEWTQQGPQPPQESSVASPCPADKDGVQLTREHLMRSANLYNMCVSAAELAIAPFVPEIARTSEQFQAIVGTLYIEASRRITSDGVTWWSYVDKMPSAPWRK